MKNFFRLFLLLIIFGVLGWISTSYAHPGRTASDGCHYCRTNCASWGYTYGTRHCHGGSSYSTPSYSSPSYSTTPDCPFMAYYDSSSKSCKCYSGYVVDTDFLGDETCISGSSKCSKLYGYHSSYNSLSKSCECDYGYVFKNDECVSRDDYCEDLMGYNAEYNILSDTCKCRYGYEQVGSRCVLESSSNTDYSYLYSLLNSGSATEVCPLNSYLATDDLCYCNTGYELNNAENACVKKTCSINSKLIGGQCTCNSGFVKSGDSCITYTDSCKLSFGENVYGFWNSEGKHLCQCNSGYEWSGNRTTCLKRKTCPNGYVNSSGNCSCNGGYVWDNINSNCIPRPTTYVDEKILREKEIKDFVDEEKKLIKDTDEKLTKKLKGKILLQVEDKGEAWYVNPKDEKKYYMADGEKAYDIMRDLGVGVTNKDLEDIKNSAIKAKKHSGKIFLQVESLGEAYYIDFDGKAHYLKDGEAAYSIMRELGLGITNNDLRKININD